MIWVLDASVALRWFLEEESHPHADLVLEKIVYEPNSFAVPELFAFEVFSVLQRLHPNGLQAYKTGIIPLLQLGIFRQPMTRRMVVKANYFVKLGLTGYDACYAGLARDLGGLWLTFDQKAHMLIEKEKISCLIEDRMPAKWLATPTITRK
jgi:predicted nucleic acid-binding protein